MAIAYHKNITSLTALRETIMNDQYVYRWFIHLIAQPAMIQRSKQEMHLAGLYRQFRRHIFNQTLFSAMFCLFVIIYLMKGSALLLLGAGMMLVVYVKALINKRRSVADLSIALIEDDFGEESIGKKALLQIGEHYAKHYNVPSLVDAIFAWDKINRRVVLGLTFFFFFIYPLWYTWEGILIALLLYFFLSNVIHLNFFYRRIK